MTDLTSSATGTGRELVAFRIGQQEFAIDITLVREIRGWTAETSIPRAPDFVRGVVNLRGAVLPILDLAARLGLPPAEPSARHVIMVVQMGQQTLGLLVDEVADIQLANDGLIQPTPEVGSELVRQFVRGVLAVDGRMIVLIALDDILPSPSHGVIAA
ncbi:chemotaxis protein CheW [Rubellimicrobium aerolatum]|uniref:Chemotaxis protein CheW n=1 Tax=Rubellimicrobium aerolatum TaxID=490979 RepID=A0ABW0SGW6_9RHOB|nr:chemotaxis protein CheW [Rubellimicrobium aerolatum]MBP1807577.1 purine-binding chemotaxis protein CheW [Rubellimicrobium aerolatum]